MIGSSRRRRGEDGRSDPSRRRSGSEARGLSRFCHGSDLRVEVEGEAHFVMYADHEQGFYRIVQCWTGGAFWLPEGSCLVRVVENVPSFSSPYGGILLDIRGKLSMSAWSVRLEASNVKNDQGARALLSLDNGDILRRLCSIRVQASMVDSAHQGTLLHTVSAIWCQQVLRDLGAPAIGDTVGSFA